jgi:hypothetical protein
MIREVISSILFPFVIKFIFRRQLIRPIDTVEKSSAAFRVPEMQFISVLRLLFNGLYILVFLTVRTVLVSPDRFSNHCSSLLLVGLKWICDIAHASEEV